MRVGSSNLLFSTTLEVCLTQQFEGHDALGAAVMEQDFDAYFMSMALREAEKAAADGEVPTGCVIVEEPEDPAAPPAAVRILGRAHNQTEMLSDATAHAEMLALSSAFAAKGAWRLSGTRLYVTKEPCPMCAGAIVLARIGTVVWGLDDPKRGGATTFNIFKHPGINHHPAIVRGVLEDECRDVLVSFFRRRRSGCGIISTSQNKEPEEYGG